MRSFDNLSANQDHFLANVMSTRMNVKAIPSKKKKKVSSQNSALKNLVVSVAIQYLSARMRLSSALAPAKNGYTTTALVSANAATRLSLTPAPFLSVMAVTKNASRST